MTDKELAVMLERAEHAVDDWRFYDWRSKEMAANIAVLVPLVRRLCKKVMTATKAALLLAERVELTSEEVCNLLCYVESRLKENEALTDKILRDIFGDRSTEGDQFDGSQQKPGETDASASKG
jgi:hypothetical protein